MHSVPGIIPAPASLEPVPGETFRVDPDTSIAVHGRAKGAGPVAEHLALLLRRPTGYAVPISQGGAGEARIHLDLSASSGLGREGYELNAGNNGVRLRAHAPDGLFHGVQTLRQLLPAKIESDTRQTGPWTVPGVRITDYPRFTWRGAMLDVARHFLPVADVKRFIDLISMYKANVLHLHLSDDQGWRIQIDRWPRLTEYGGSLEVGGSPGGYYTKEDFSDLVQWAASRFVTIVPEIDVPGHTTAALASYAELNCTGQAPPLYTGTGVGFSSLCVGKDVTYEFLDDVIGEIAELTLGPHIHIGGDEAGSISASDYKKFIERVEKIVHAHDKRMVGWHEITSANVSSDTVAQYWGSSSGSHRKADPARRAVHKGMQLVMSPSDRAYMDMKYEASTPLGVSWAGSIDVAKSYEWDPATYVDGVEDADVLGVEAALWTETVPDMTAAEFMTFPRWPGIAEIGWSRRGRSWDEYRTRLAAQGPRWNRLAVNYYRSPTIDWDDDQ